MTDEGTSGDTSSSADGEAGPPRVSRGRLVLIAAVGSLVVGWAVSGDLLYHSLIGLDSSGFPLGEWIQSTFFPSATKAVGGIFVAVVVLLALGAGFFVLGRRAAPTDAEGRRAFLAGSAAGASALAAGLGGALSHLLLGVGKTGGEGWASVQSGVNSNEGIVKTHPTWEDAWKGARVARYGRLGRTEWKISDTVLGAGRLRENDWKLVLGALDRGVNYIDTAPDYSVEGSELAVGRALREWRREEVFLATKFCTPIGHLPAGTPVARYKEVVEQSLARMGTDYVDLVHVHSCDDVDRLMDPNVHEAFDRLKEEGKARFLGVSTHTPRLQVVANQAIDSGRFDVIMLAYHHGIWPRLGEIVDRAHDEQDMGVVAMKTLKGARHRNLADFHDANSYAQAALKWVHANPKVSCAVISFFETQHLDEYLFASGKTLTSEDVAVLNRYDQAIVGSYCAPHCGVCLDSCPEGVPIADVLRHRMYFEDYRDERNAMELYARLSVDASACDGCDAPCLASCPVGIDIPTRTRGAHAMLSFGT